MGAHFRANAIMMACFLVAFMFGAWSYHDNQLPGYALGCLTTYILCSFAGGYVTLSGAKPPANHEKGLIEYEPYR